MSELNLGQLITTPQKRDAIHVAVAPVVAGEALDPGAHVVLIRGLAHNAREGRAIGIVDPFLPLSVMDGESFWLFLYPKSTQNLRHDWDHPAFPSAPSSQPVASKDVEESKAWLKVYVSRHCPYDEEAPDRGLQKFLDHVEVWRWIYYHGSDCHSLEDVEDAETLFRHLSIVMGRKIDASYFEAFTCSC